MFSTRFTLVAASLFCGSVAFAQDSTETAQELPTADEVVDAYIENTGGKEAWANLKSMQTDASLAMGPMEFAAKVTTARPNKQYVEMDLQGQKMVIGYDGEQGWQINPMSGSTKAVAMPPEQAEQTASQTLEPALFNYKEKGYTAKVIGTESVDGTPTYDLELTRDSGQVEHYYFDQEYMVPIMQSSEVVGADGKKALSQTYLSDYQSVDGMMMPMANETKMDSSTIQKMTLSNMVLNPDIDESIFTMPTDSTGSGK